MLRWVGLAIGVTFLGCSSSSSGSGSSCTDSASCGGNLVGTWNITQACTGNTSVGQSNNTFCPSETVVLGTPQVSGSITFNSDMSYSLALTEMISETVTVPASCLTVNGLTLTCDQIAQVFNSVTQSGDAGTSPTTCAAAGGGCNCALSSATVNYQEGGSYTTSGSNYTTTPTTGNGGPGGGTYCVSGSTLRVVTTPAGVDSGPVAGVTYVATKE
jgi:hypothetical protein